MAICLCDKEIFSINLNEITTGKLWMFFTAENSSDNILVVYDENNNYYGICTYGLLLSANGNIDKCILKEKVYLSDAIWDDAKKIFNSNENIRYLPVFNNNDELNYFCYNDEKLDVFLNELEEMKEQKQWMLLEAISPSLQAICFFDVNEVAYKLYELATLRNVPTIILGEKWEAFSLKNNAEELNKYPDFEVLFINSRRNTICQDKNDPNYIKTIDYASIHEIYFMNVLSVAVLRNRNIEETLYNLVIARDEILKRLKGIYFKELFFETGKKIDYMFLSKFITDEELLHYVSIIKHTWKKEIAGIYGNCETEIIYNVLYNIDKFMDKYIFLYMPRICNNKMVLGQEHWPEQVGLCFDLLIYQEVAKDNKFSPKASSDYLKKTLKDSCKLVSVTNAYFKGYFPQVKQIRNNHVILKKDDTPLFELVDNNIIKEYSDCHNIKEAIRRLSDENYYEGREDIVISNLNDSLEELEKREKIVDVKIADYIRENYKKVRLFSEPSHPSTELLIEVTKRLLIHLGIEDYHINDVKLESLFSRNSLIYPSVSKILGLEFTVEEYTYDRNFNEQKISFEEFIELYIRNCLPV